MTRRCSDRSSVLLGGKKTSDLTLEKILEAIPAAVIEVDRKLPLLPRDISTENR